MFERYADIQRQRRQGLGEGGFTLIELLIVIVVLGILATIVVFSLGGITSQSAQSACNADAKSVEIAVQAYHAESTTGAWPDVATAQAELVPAYLRTWPNSQHYTVSVAANGEVDVTPTGGAATNYDTGNGAICSTVK